MIIIIHIYYSLIRYSSFLNRCVENVGISLLYHSKNWNMKIKMKQTISSSSSFFFIYSLYKFCCVCVCVRSFTQKVRHMAEDFHQKKIDDLDSHMKNESHPYTYIFYFFFLFRNIVHDMHPAIVTKEFDIEHVIVSIPIRHCFQPS